MRCANTCTLRAMTCSCGECGAEMLVETARLWSDLGFYSEAKGGKFCINAVTGPDEYNTVVNNNAYTNLMARENLRYAVADRGGSASNGAGSVRCTGTQNGARTVRSGSLETRRGQHVCAL